MKGITRKFNWITINDVNGFYWLPTLHTWRLIWGDLPEVSLVVSYGIAVKFLKFEYGFIINIDSKNI